MLKNQKKKFRPMSPVQPLHGSELIVLFFFLSVFLVLAGLPKSAQKQKTNSSDLCLLSSLSMGLNFFFGCFFLVLAGLPKSAQKQKSKKFRPMSAVQPLHGSELFFFWFWVVLADLQKSAQTQKQQTKSLDLCLLSSLSMGLIFFVLAGLPKSAQKQNKKTISSGPWRGWTGDIGLIFLCF